MTRDPYVIAFVWWLFILGGVAVVAAVVGALWQEARKPRGYSSSSRLVTDLKPPPPHVPAPRPAYEDVPVEFWAERDI